MPANPTSKPQIPTTPTCPRALEVADRWFDGFEHGELRLHIRTCEECAGIADTARLVRGAIIIAFPAPALADTRFVWQEVARRRRKKLIVRGLISLTMIALAGFITLWLW